ncbi:MAG: sulfur oxidation c-type cytochrome SoxA [Chromatiaceae bacterium]|nr:sulfur oxidation c-type cytochrome SoxA [Chromatiaceae bacterium]
MKFKFLALAAIYALSASVVMADKKATDTTPAEDLKVYRDYFQKRFPGIPLDEYANGAYALDAVARDNWLAIEEFPPYEPMIEAGEAVWNTSFANGKNFASCFSGDPAQRQNFPYWDAKRKMVVTMELAINECLESNGEKPMGYNKGKIADLAAYMAYQSRGQKTNVEIPDDADAMKAYNAGKSYYFTRRGQLNFSCAHCHMESAGQHIRSELLSPALGHTTGWPVYRAKWGELGTLHRRFGGCNEQVRAKKLKPQSEEYRDLEFFLTHMSNGIEYNGPSARK